MPINFYPPTCVIVLIVAKQFTDFFRCRIFIK